MERWALSPAPPRWSYTFTVVLAVLPVFSPLSPAVRVARGETPVNPKRAVLVFALCAAAAAAGNAADALFATPRRARTSSRPCLSLGGWQIPASLELTLVLECALAAWLIARARRWRPLAIATIVLVAAWWLLPTRPPVRAFPGLTATPFSSPRYLQLALPGAALASTAMAALFIRPAPSGRRVSVIFALGVLLFLGQMARQVWPRHPQLRLARRPRAPVQPTRSRRRDPRDLPQPVH